MSPDFLISNTGFVKTTCQRERCDTPGKCLVQCPEKVAVQQLHPFGPSVPLRPLVTTPNCLPIYCFLGKFQSGQATQLPLPQDGS